MHGVRVLAIAAALSVLATAVLASTTTARADPPACPDTPPDDAEVTRRLDWIERVIDRDEDDVRRWYAAFVVAHTLLAGVNVALAFAADVGSNADQEVWWRSRAAPFVVNATGSTLGLITILASTPPILGAGDFVRRLPRGTPGERLVSLREAERRLQRDHDAVAFVRGPLASVASAVYVGAASSLLLAFDHTVPAMIHALGGTVLAQGRLLLHPTGPLEAWRTYASRHPDAACDPIETIARYDETPRLAIAPSLFGVAIQLAF